MNAKLNKRERRAQALLAHYATCERLARHLGAATPDGKKISVALWKLEREAHRAAEAHCNGTPFATSYGPQTENLYHFGANETDWEDFGAVIRTRVERVLGHTVPGFFVNGDARGYALKIDPDNQQGRELIEAAGLHKDWGGYGILSPEITGGE